jgi:hypothetical protein
MFISLYEILALSTASRYQRMAMLLGFLGGVSGVDAPDLTGGHPASIFRNIPRLPAGGKPISCQLDFLGSINSV